MRLLSGGMRSHTEAWIDSGTYKRASRERETGPMAKKHDQILSRVGKTRVVKQVGKQSTAQVEETSTAHQQPHQYLPRVGVTRGE